MAELSVRSVRLVLDRMAVGVSLPEAVASVAELIDREVAARLGAVPRPDLPLVDGARSPRYQPLPQQADADARRTRREGR